MKLNGGVKFRDNGKLYIFTIVPASCQCGGAYAWVWNRSRRTEIMIGCVCHNPIFTLVNKAKRIDEERKNAVG